MTNFLLINQKEKRQKNVPARPLLAILDSKSISNRVDQDEF